MLGEGLPGDEAAHALADVDVAILEDDLSLADDHQRGAAALHAFEDVVLHGLRGENHRVQSAPQAFLCMSPAHPEGDSATQAITGIFQCLFFLENTSGPRSIPLYALSLV